MHHGSSENAGVKTYPLFRRVHFWHAAVSMFLRSTNRKKDGKDHRYFSIVENRRLLGGKTAQRTVLYLGEINDQQQAAWRKTLDVFDENEQRYTTMSLFPDDRGASRRRNSRSRTSAAGPLPYGRNRTPRRAVPRSVSWPLSSGRAGPRCRILWRSTGA